MKKIFVIIASVVLIFSSFLTHDFYTSMTKVEYNTGTKSLKFATKIDLEQIESALNKKINAGDFDQTLKNYLMRNVEVSINDVPTKYNYTGKQESGEIVWIYYEIENIGTIQSIGIKNTLFLEKNANQQNFVSFSVNGKKGSFVCGKGKEFGKQNF
jgi:hypothetical protein